MIILRDVTLREGRDVPGVGFTVAARRAIVEALARAGVPEAEVVAPYRVAEDIAAARELGPPESSIRISGLVYANRPGWRSEVESACEVLDRVDLVMPLSPHREPREGHAKADRLVKALLACRELPLEVGAGFPHATQVDPDSVVELSRRAEEAGARRITLYDTNGGSEPFGVRQLTGRIVAEVSVPVFFHAHNDLGLATANAWAAASAGAAGLDVTVNGLGDRAGNASLEQAVVLLHSRNMSTGVDPSALEELSRVVAAMSGVPVSPLAPIVGRHVFDHVSPAHAETPTEFEPFDPAMIGATRRVR
jgi:isopropylmalate/homocitrate/citramalate synthase